MNTPWKPPSLLAFHRNVYSQNGEDGILAEILRRLGIERGACVDVGANDGRAHSNVLALIERGWSGVLIERDPEQYATLRQLRDVHPGRLVTICKAVGFGRDDGLDAVLSETALPSDFDLLNIDIDGYDFQVWCALKTYRPKIVVIEINSSIPLGVEQVHGHGKQGASFSAMLALGTRKGYRIACHTGNCLFVRADLFDALGLPAKEAKDPDGLFGYMGPQ